MTAKPLIHIGYHKTGSNWLRRNLFPRTDLGFMSFDKYAEIQDHILFPNPLDFDAEKAIQAFRPRMEEAYKEGLLPVIASENLSGNPHSGGYSSKENADRLAQIFPDGKIIIVLREQESIVYAQYKQYVRIGGTGSVDEFLLPPEEGRSRIPLFDFDHYKYHRLIKYYQKLFGRDNVLVLLYEQFKESPQKFVDAVLDFAEIRLDEEKKATLPFSKREHEGLSGSVISVRRRLNKWILKDRVNYVVPFPVANAIELLNKASTPIDRVTPESLNRWIEQRRKSRVKELIADRYHESNLLTAQCTALDLFKYGYK